MLRLAAILACSLLVACGSNAAPEASERTRTPTTPRATAASTPVPEPETAWPTEFEDDLCLAIDQLGQATKDIAEMRRAAETGDIDRMSLMAYAAGGYALTVQMILSDVPSWEPGDSAISALAAVTDDLVAGLDLIDVGAQQLDGAMIEEGAALVGSAAAALENEVQPLLVDLRANSGFTC